MTIIEKVIESKLPGVTEEYLVNKKTGKRYSRIFGGIAWPGRQPGCGVVVAEEFEIDETLNKRHYRILAEYENQNPTDLIRRCAEFSRGLSASPFYGDDNNRPMMEILQRRGLGLYIRDAPFADESDAFEAYLLTIRELASPTKKILHFGQDSIFPALLAEINSLDIPNTTETAFQQHPAITALGFAVLALEMSVYDPGEDARAEAVIIQELIERAGD